MIKVNHLSKQAMDLVMGLARETNNKPDEVIKIILNNTDYEEAKRAINNDQENLQKTYKNFQN